MVSRNLTDGLRTKEPRDTETGTPELQLQLRVAIQNSLIVDLLLLVRLFFVFEADFRIALPGWFFAFFQTELHVWVGECSVNAVRCSSLCALRKYLLVDGLLMSKDGHVDQRNPEFLC